MSENRKSKIENRKSNTIPSFWRQIRWHLLLSFVLLAILPMAIVVIATLSRSRVQATNQVVSQLESVAELKRGQIVRWLDDSQFALKQVVFGPKRHSRLITLAAATDGQVQDSSSYQAEQNTFNGLFGNIADADPLFIEFFLYNVEGQIVVASDPARIGQSVTGQPYFADSLAEDYVQPPYYAVDDSKPVMFITYPLVDDQSGQTVGVLAGQLDMNTLRQIMVERTVLGESGETYLVRSENNYLLTPSRFESEGYVLNRPYHSTGIDQALQEENGFGTYAD